MKNLFNYLFFKPVIENTAILTSPLFCLLLIGMISLLCESCTSDEEACPLVECNTGVQNEETCECDCPENYTGVDCSEFNPERVQSLLDAGQTPLGLYNGGIPLDSLYGKLYQGGFLYYLNTDNGTGLVAATEDQATNVNWWQGFSIDIMELNNVSDCAEDCLPPEPAETEEGSRIGDGTMNTDLILATSSADSIAAKFCRGLGEEWFLPSRGELNLMFTNLRSKGEMGNFAPAYYWSSTEDSTYHAWRQHMGAGNQASDVKFDYANVRAAKAF